jgi:2-oxoacid:acceptor oxidoreductase gamma subunit (pyruvate/2-ketoisovalerate family)
MIEVRFHGRGGQGAVVASEILAAALFAEGKHVQAFPAFGIERRGAPVTAFLRMSSSPIRLRCQIESPDHVVILDPTLIPVVDVTAGLKPGGWIVINTDHAPSSFAFLAAQRWRVASVDAAAIAIRHQLGGRTNPIVNTAILGAFAYVTGLVKLESIIQAIEEGVPLKPNQNREAAREAFAAVHMPVLEEVES